MADEQDQTLPEKDTPKSVTIGIVDAKAVAKIPGWTEYKAASNRLTEARKESEAKKTGIRDHFLLKLKGKTASNGTKITGESNIDFTVELDGSVRVTLTLEKKKRGKSEDLSGLF
jgi:hypothetical protein